MTKCPLCKNTVWIENTKTGVGECRGMFCPIITFNVSIRVRREQE